MKDILFKIFFDEIRTSWWTYFYQGLIFVLAGVVLIVWPEIIIALIASIFFLIGFFILTIAWQVRKIQKRVDHITINFID